MNWDQPFGQWVDLAFSAVLTGAGGTGLVSEVRELLRAFSSRRWPYAEAEVLAVSVEERRGARGRIRFEPVVRYRYVWSGRPLEATRFAFGTLHAGSRSEAERLVAELKVGSKGRAKVCPTRPELAVLAPGPNGFIWFALVFFCIYTGLAVSYFVSALKPFFQ